jgi:DNA modification methylase
MNDTNQDQARLRRAASNEGTSAGLPVGRVLIGDAVRQLQRLPAGSVDTVVTSPPYFMLRNYGMEGQIGLESSVADWVDRLLAALDEVARVLKPTGSLWLNLGDTYARRPSHGAEPKSLVLGPEKLLVALTDRGWRVRNKVVWAKPNPMPASVRDRLNSTWEPLYLLTRQDDYYFDLDAIRVPARSRLTRPSVAGARTKYGVRGPGRPTWSGPLAGSNSGLEKMKAGGRSAHPLGKNPGDVWTIPTASFRGAHFATFPEALVEPQLLATCPERVCRSCDTPWRRARVARHLGATAVQGTMRKSCGCADPAWQPGVVLDPFMGAGTVAVVAERLHRRWLGIELNPEFARMATQRIRQAKESAA